MQPKLQQPSKRIEYIDALRGFTMILVVFSHIEWFCFEVRSSFINELFISFRMPLFFFISGLIGYRANIIWNWAMWWKMSKKKMLVQIVPTMVFGLTFACLFQKNNVLDFICHETKLGYWFTIVLFEMFLLAYTMNLALHKCREEQTKILKLISLGILSITLFAIRMIPQWFPSCQSAFDILSLHQTIKYFPFFAFGYICSMYKDLFERFLNNRYIITMVLAMFATLFYVKTTYLTPNAGSGMAMFFTEIIVEMINGILGLVIVYNTFRIYANTFGADRRMGRTLQTIGKRTLDIYLLHFFFLPHIPQIGSFLAIGNNIAIELFLGIGLSILVIVLCLAVSCVIRTSPILGKYFFGAK